MKPLILKREIFSKFFDDFNLSMTQFTLLGIKPFAGLTYAIVQQKGLLDPTLQNLFFISSDSLQHLIAYLNEDCRKELGRGHLGLFQNITERMKTHTSVSLLYAAHATHRDYDADFRKASADALADARSQAQNAHSHGDAPKPWWKLW